MNIFKLLPITAISLNLNYCSSFAETEFAETYSVVWDGEKNQADVKKTPKNLIDDFVTQLKKLIKEYHFLLAPVINPHRISRDPGTPLYSSLKNIEQFKGILEEKIKEYFSSKCITYDETALKDFINQLFLRPETRMADYKTVNELTDRIIHEQDPDFSQYISKIFKTEK